MILSVLSFLGGIISLHQLAVLPETLWLLVSLLILPVLYRYKKFKPVFWLLCGFFWAWVQAGWFYQHNLPDDLEGKDTVVTGEIISVPEFYSNRSKFIFSISHAKSDYGEWKKPGKVRLAWYGKPKDLKPGQIWQFNVRMKKPNGFMNPSGFDYESWLFQQGINAVGYVRKSDDNRLIDSQFNFQLIRQYIKTGLSKALVNAEYKGIMLALALGLRGDIDQKQWDVLQRTGTSHLIAISGLHIGLVAGFCFFIGRFLWVRLPSALALRYPAPKVAAIFAMTGAVFYAFLAGLALPTQRALIMIAVVMISLLADRVSRPGRVLSLSLFVILFIDSSSVLSPGFWLSFSAVGVLLYAMTGRIRSPEGWRSWGRAQWIVTIGLVPLTLFIFQKTSVISPLANSLAIPWVSFLIVPLLLIGTIVLMLYEPAGQLILTVCNALLKPMDMYLIWLSELPFAQWVQHSPSVWVILVSVVAVVLLLSPKGLPLKFVGLILLFPVFLVVPATLPDASVRFTVLDVGQGLASVIETKNHVVVFDSGPKFSDRFDTGNSVVMPYLRQQGINKIDLLIISHGDNDHSGGAQSIVNQIDTVKVVSGEPKKLENINASKCKSGQEWSWDGVKFKLLHPDGSMKFRKNDLSCVLKVITTNGSILLTGDIHKKSERHLVKYNAADLKSDILIAPHHGSKTSSHQAFIDNVAADYVVFPTGYKNRFKHPRPVVKQRYERTNAVLYNSSEHGAIQFMLGGDSPDFNVITFRQLNTRHWHRKNN
ncbi:MAG: DNA internalization-related competence protein ComEC/Rec2 [Gammaproteobacteria bacterium]|nr:DNA internalization-related competence protein ComEC/Rec2 [Gammaproteobacteria bacterium]